VTHPGVG